MSGLGSRVRWVAKQLVYNIKQSGSLLELEILCVGEDFPLDLVRQDRAAAKGAFFASMNFPPGCPFDHSRRRREQRQGDLALLTMLNQPMCQTIRKVVLLRSSITMRAACSSSTRSPWISKRRWRPFSKRGGGGSTTVVAMKRQMLIKRALRMLRPLMWVWSLWRWMMSCHHCQMRVQSKQGLLKLLVPAEQMRWRCRRQRRRRRARSPSAAGAWSGWALGPLVVVVSRLRAWAEALRRAIDASGTGRGAQCLAGAPRSGCWGRQFSIAASWRSVHGGHRGRREVRVLDQWSSTSQGEGQRALGQVVRRPSVCHLRLSWGLRGARENCGGQDYIVKRLHGGRVSQRERGTTLGWVSPSVWHPGLAAPVSYAFGAFSSFSLRIRASGAFLVLELCSQFL